MTVVGVLILVGLVAWAYLSIPAEDPEIVEARKQYGRVD